MEMTKGVSPRRLEAILSGLDDESARVLRFIWEKSQEGAAPPDEMVSVSADVSGITAGLGIPPISLLVELYEIWPDLAGPRWGSMTRPVVVRHGELIIEAVDHRIVRWFRYDTEQLMDRIAAHFGGGFVIKVRIVSPLEKVTW